MTASINGRALTNGEFVCVVDGITYVGLVRAWNYTQATPEQQPAVTLDGVITDQQRNAPPANQELAARRAPAGPRGRLTVQIIPWNALPLVGDRDTLYIVNDPLARGGEILGIVDEAAYVYRPDDREGPDPAPYKATNVSAAVVARLHDSGDQIRSQAAITRGSVAVPVQYTLAERPNDQLEVCTSDNFVTWMPIEWRLNEIPVRSRPGHVFPEVQNALASLSRDHLDEVTRSELSRRAARQAVASAFSGLVVTYVSCLDELPVHGEEHRLYCIYGYEAAYVYRRGHAWPYRPTNLSAAALAENYADGATLERAPPARAVVVISFNDDSHGWRPVRPRDEQGQYCCSWRVLLPAGVSGEPLEGRRDNTADLRVDFSAPLVTAIPTQAVQGDLVTVPIPRDLSLEQVVFGTGGVTLNITQTQANWRPSASFSQAFFNPRANATGRAPAEAPPAPFVPQMLPVTAGPRRILPLNG